MKSNWPVYKAEIYCFGYAGSTGQQEEYKNFSTFTNSKGEYFLIIPSEFRFSFQSVDKSGYLTKLFPLKSGYIQQKGDTTIVDVQLIPKDGYLRLEIKNAKSPDDSIYVQVASPTTIAEGFYVTKTASNPTVLLPDSTFSELLDFPSEEIVTIFWDVKPFVYPNAAFKDSVYLPAKDTVDFMIDY